MSTPDWSSVDLELFSNICERISGYRGRLEPHLQSLPDKYQDLGQKLHDSSGRLQKLSTRYHDPDLEKHLDNADRDLQTQLLTSKEPNAGLASWIPGRRRNNEITTRRINQLHFEVDIHIDTAEKFRTEFLFKHTYPKLQYVLRKLVQQVQSESGTLSITDTNPVNPNERESTTHNTQPSSSVLLPNGNRDAKILAHAPNAINIARILWKSRADTLDLDQRRPRPSDSSSTDAAKVREDEHILAKEKFLNDVLSLIEETRLDDLGLSAGGPPRDVLERLAGIVSQAAELKETLPSPEISAIQTSIRPSPRPTRRWDTPTPPHTSSSSSSPRAVGPTRTIPRKPLPQHSNPMSPPNSGDTAPVGDSVGPSDLGGSWQEVGYAEPSSRLEFPSIGSPAISSSDSGSLIGRGDKRETPFPHLSAVAIGKLPARTQGAAHDQSSSPSSWIKISSLEAGLTPSFCTLKFASWKDKNFLLAVVTTDFVPSPSAMGSAQRVVVHSPPTFYIHHPNRSHPFSNARTFEHLILPDTRPMPSVIYPDYEGPGYRPESPYTITFTEKQSLCEYTVNPRPQLVGDLEYIFYDKAERDRIRSNLFGKRLLLHAGVQTIKFHYIACQLEAVSLWEDATNKPLTITFNRNSDDPRSRPRGEVEYEIVALVSYGDPLKADDPLKLKVRQVAGPGTRESASEKKDCRLFLSRSDEKAAFISILNPPQPNPS